MQLICMLPFLPPFQNRLGERKFRQIRACQFKTLRPVKGLQGIRFQGLQKHTPRFTLIATSPHNPLKKSLYDEHRPAITSKVGVPAFKFNEHFIVKQLHSLITFCHFLQLACWRQFTVAAAIGLFLFYEVSASQLHVSDGHTIQCEFGS